MRRPGSGRCICCCKGTCWSRQACKCIRARRRSGTPEVSQPRSRGVERRSCVGRFKTRFERPWFSNWPPAAHCSTVASKKTRTGLLFKRIPHVVDVQIALLLLTFCAATRVNYWLRTVPPKLTAEHARVHDNRVLQCLCDVLHIRNGLPGQFLETASLPLTLRGLGVGAAVGSGMLLFGAILVTV